MCPSATEVFKIIMIPLILSPIRNVRKVIYVQANQTVMFVIRAILAQITSVRPMTPAIIGRKRGQEMKAENAIGEEKLQLQ